MKSRRSQQKPSQLKDILSGTALSNLSLRSRISQYKVQSIWPKIVGEIISKRTSPVKLMDSVLYVNVASQSWITELSFQKVEILERINRELEESELIKEIRFRPGSVIRTTIYVDKKPSPAPNRQIAKPDSKRLLFIDKTVSNVKDKSLRDLIRRTMKKGSF